MLTVLAHLDLIGRKDAEEALLAVDDDASDSVSSFLYTAYGIRVVLVSLVLYEPKIEGYAASRIESEHDAPVVSPVSSVQMHKAGTGERRLLPCLFHISEATLDGRRTYTMCCSKFGNSLLAVLIGTPKVRQCHFMAVTELIPTFSTYV